MANPSARKLTKRLIDSLPTPEKRTEYRDTDLTGFALRVSPTGQKSFHLRYRTKTGQQRNPKIGIYGKLTVDEARRIAKTWLAEVERGGDPSGERIQRRNAENVKEFSEIYLEDAKVRMKPKPYSDEKRYFKNHINPALGRIKLADVTHDDVKRLHAKIGKKHKTAANRCVSVLHRFYKHAHKYGFTEAINPAAGIDRFKENKCERYLTLDEYARMGQAISELVKDRDKAGDEARAIVSRPVLDAIRLLLLTGYRKGEVMTLRWADVDLERYRVTLGDTKEGRQLRIINQATVDALRAIRKHQHDTGMRTDWVCPSPRDHSKHVAEIKTGWKRILKKAGLKGIRPHDMRHSFASVSASSEASLQVTGSLIGHRDMASTQRYAHLHDAALRTAGDAVGGTIAEALTGGAQIVDLAADDPETETADG